MRKFKCKCKWAILIRLSVKLRLKVQERFQEVSIGNLNFNLKFLKIPRDNFHWVLSRIGLQENDSNNQLSERKECRFHRNIQMYFIV
jgi:hypothetical protein